MERVEGLGLRKEKESKFSAGSKNSSLGIIRFVSLKKSFSLETKINMDLHPLKDQTYY